MIDVQVISEILAKQLSEQLCAIGVPPENRVVICVTDQKTTASGIIIPDEVKEGVCKKGVIVQAHITDEYQGYSKMIKIGSIAYYGDYAGKELDIQLNGQPAGSKLRVLSINEIMYLKNNG